MIHALRHVARARTHPTTHAGSHPRPHLAETGD
jgi:hypothetical protein